MLIFIISIILIVAGVIWGRRRPYGIAPVILWAFSLSVLFLTSFAVATNYAMVNGDYASKQQTYESLTYQVEHNFYDNDNEIGRKQLVSEIQKWNEKLAYGKNMKDNIFIGVFFPDKLYDDFDYISLKNIK